MRCVIRFFLGFMIVFFEMNQSNAQWVNVQDSLALVDLYNSTNGPNWTNQYGWLAGPVKDWEGVSVVGQRVIGINLGSNNMIGTIPSSIGNVRYLTVFAITDNQLTGNIPSSIGNLSYLQTVFLHGNDLTGSIPQSMGNLVNLRDLFLYGNELTGEIPPPLGNLTNLIRMSLDNNHLTGSIPSTFGNLTILEELSLSNNELSGAIPILPFPALLSLQLERNNFLFDELEAVVQHFSFATYSPQAQIKLHNSGSILSVNAGGTLGNNTYKWYRNDQLIATIVGNSAFIATNPGNYRVEVTNAIATQLTLFSNTIHFISVKVIDPNPSMILNNGTLTTTITALDTAKIVNGAATDGITKVLLYSNSTTQMRFWVSDSSDGSFSSLSNQNSTFSEVTISPVNGKVVAIYNAPDGFGNTFDNQTSRQIAIKAAFLNSADSTIIDFKLVTPPVVMVHGMWSGPSVWDKDGFTNFLTARGFSAPVLADYGEKSYATFNPSDGESIYGITAVRTAVLQSLLNYKNLKIAASQVDVVAHSLGGLMARSYSQKPYFIQQVNYYKGYIHKLITLGTPHKGSPFGPELWRNKDNLLWLPGTTTRLPITLSALLALGGRKIGSCHRDFGIQSDGINALSQTLPFKTFSVTADYSGQTGGYNIMNGLSQFAFNKTLNQVMSSRCDGNPPLINDLIVPLNSQRGFVSGGKDTLFTNIAHSWPGNLTETNSPLVQLKVAKLLLSSNASDFGNGFPAPSLIRWIAMQQHNEMLIPHLQQNGL